MTSQGTDAERGLRNDRVWTIPNVISMLRLLLVPVFAWLIVAEHDIAALTVLIVAGASDWLDGVIARRFDQVSELGRLLDPAADRLYILVTLVGLAYRDLIPWWLVAIIVARDVVLACLVPPLRRLGYRTLPVHAAGKAGTFGLMYAFPLLLIGAMDSVVGEIAWVVGWACALWGVGLYWFACVLYLLQTRRLMRAAPREAGS